MFYAVLAIALVLVFMSLRIAQEYERGVVFRLGRLVGSRGPGLYFLIPFIERAQTLDLRTATYELPPHEVITRDNVTLKVAAVLYFRIKHPAHAITMVRDYKVATVQIAQTTLRNVIGQSSLDEVLSHRAEINARLQGIIDHQTDPWGVQVSVVEIKDVELPASMQRAMAREGEAVREKRAKIVHAEGEFQASQQLAEAAKVIAAEPMAMQLRYLATLHDIAAERNSTIIFPLPVELMQHFMRAPRPE
jgi:regulator of protease activity HflC (stomatin/prohibitin superfamily)